MELTTYAFRFYMKEIFDSVLCDTNNTTKAINVVTII